MGSLSALLDHREARDQPGGTRAASSAHDPIAILARAAERAATDGGLSRLQVQLVANAVIALVILLTATALSVYKPRGVRGAGPMAPWAKFAAWAVGACLVAIALIHLLGGGSATTGWALPSHIGKV